MKTHPLLPLLCLGLAVLPVALPAQDGAAASPAPAAPETGLRFNFRGAPLESVLNYLSDAAGFVIVLETPVRGTVDMWSSQPVSKTEAVQLLNLALNKNGFTARVQGRNLIVASKEEAKKTSLPIRTGNDPAEIPETADMVMQIIPLVHVEAAQAARDLATLLPSTSTITANTDSNALIVTDTQINVRHVVEIVAALDGSIDSAATIRVFRLKNADPVEMAQLLTSLFGSTASTNSNATQVMGGPGGMFPGGPFGFGGGNNNNNSGGNNNSRRSNSRNTTSSRGSSVVAVADSRTLSVVVTASKNQMAEIESMIAQLDTASGRKQKVFVYTLQNGDVKQVETILKNLFQSSTTRSSSSSSQADPLSTRASNNSQTSSSSTSSLSLGSSSSR